MDNMKTTYLWLVIIMLVSLGATAQPANASWINITSEDGLPTNSISSIVQGANGFIYIGTWNGAFRFDGRNFIEIDHRDNRLLTPDSKGGVWISNDDGNVLYYHPAIDSIREYVIPDPQRFTGVTIDEADNLWLEGKRGVMLLDPESGEVTMEEQLEGWVSVIQVSETDELLFNIRLQDGGLKIGRRTVDGQYSYEDYPLDENQEGNPYLLDNYGQGILSYRESGAFLFNDFGWAMREAAEADWTFYPYTDARTGNNVRSVLYDPAGYVWIGQRGGLSRIRIDDNTTTYFEHDPKNPSSILEANKQSISDLMLDRQGNLWAGIFSRGLSVLNTHSSDFGLALKANGDPYLDVLAALEQEDGSYWLGERVFPINGLWYLTPEGDVIRSFGSSSFDPPPGRTISNQLSHPFVWTLAETSDGSIWAGTYSPGGGGGLNRIKPGSDQVIRWAADPGDPDAIPSNGARIMLKDGKDRLWIYGSDYGTYIMDTETEKVSFPKYDFGNGLTERFDPYMITQKGDIIIGQRNPKRYLLVDVNTLDATPFGVGVHQQNMVWLRHLDDNGRIWFTTKDGFGSLNETYTEVDYFVEYNSEDFPDVKIELVNSDEDGVLWFGTTMGIIRFDPNTGDWHQYGYERGLQGNRFENYMPYKGPSGKLYFGGFGGVNIFDPAEITSNPIPPEMSFTALRLDGDLVRSSKDGAIKTSIEVADEVIVGSEYSSFTIDFSALHFSNYKSNKYQYRLEGFDDDWRDGGNIGTATYTNLFPKKYTLFIKGSNLDGIWSDGSDSIDIIVLPPWYMTWWAYVSYLVLFCLALLGLYRYQRNRTIRIEREKTKDRELAQAREIEKAYKDLKATQAQLIHSEKMASLGELTAGIAHEIQNPLNFVNNFSEVSTEMLEEIKEEIKEGNTSDALEIIDDLNVNLEKINHHGGRASGIVRSMLHHSRGSSTEKELTDMNQLADEYLRLSYHGLRAKDKTFNASYHANLDEDVPKIKVVPQDIGRVLLNLINNAFYAVDQRKRTNTNAGYSPSVEVATKEVSNGLEIRVIDNGTGISAKAREKIFQPFFTTKPTGQGTGLGLSLSYEIVKAHGGDIKVESEVGVGTEFVVILPVGEHPAPL